MWEAHGDCWENSVTGIQGNCQCCHPLCGRWHCWVGAAVGHACACPDLGKREEMLSSCCFFLYSPGVLRLAELVPVSSLMTTGMLLLHSEFQSASL